MSEKQSETETTVSAAGLELQGQEPSASSSELVRVRKPLFQLLGCQMTQMWNQSHCPLLCANIIFLKANQSRPIRRRLSQMPAQGGGRREPCASGLWPSVSDANRL